MSQVLTLPSGIFYDKVFEKVLINGINKISIWTNIFSVFFRSVFIFNGNLTDMIAFN